MTPQQPTREQIAALRAVAEGPHPADSGLDSFTLAFVLARIDALFPQPNPAPLVACPHWNGGWERGEVTMRRGCTACEADARDAASPATPPNIADMAPGTTLGIEFRWTVVRDPSGATFLYRDNNGYAQWLLAADIDPSTIRDVTPPPATPDGPEERGTLVVPPTPSEDAVHLPVTPAVPRNEEGTPKWVSWSMTRHWHAMSAAGATITTVCGMQVSASVIIATRDERPEEVLYGPTGICPVCDHRLKEA